MTKQWWGGRRNLFELFTSVIVVDEAAAGDTPKAEERLTYLAGMPVLEWSRESLELAKLLIKRKALPPKSRDDAGHLAIAAVAGMDYLLTWNYRHLINASLRLLMQQACKKAGFRCPLICTPEQLLKGPVWRTKS